MIYRCKFKTLDFLSLDLLTSRSFLPNGHKNSRHLSETVKLVSVSEFDVKTVNNFIAFDFPFRIMCASYQIHRQHPWIRKTILQNLSSAPTPMQIISRCFFKICIISFSYLVKYIYRFWHLLSPRTTKLWWGYRVCPVRMYVRTFVRSFVCSPFVIALVTSFIIQFRYNFTQVLGMTIPRTSFCFSLKGSRSRLQ